MSKGTPGKAAMGQYGFGAKRFDLSQETEKGVRTISLHFD